MLHDDGVRVLYIPSPDSHGHLEVHVWSVVRSGRVDVGYVLTCCQVTSKFERGATTLGSMKDGVRVRVRTSDDDG